MKRGNVERIHHSPFVPFLNDLWHHSPHHVLSADIASTSYNDDCNFNENVSMKMFQIPDLGLSMSQVS